jgi:UDP-N-acetylmuramate dehydrogenase
LKIGGLADIFVNCLNGDQFLSILQYISNNNIKEFTILGNGSNILISDSGLRGIVIKNSSSNIDILNKIEDSKNVDKIDTHRTENEPDAYLNFNNLDYDESNEPTVLVKIDSGVNLPYAINYLIENGVTGLQWFGYIPGTIGGAIYCNIHGGKYHFSDYIHEIEVLNLDTNQTKTYPKNEFGWDYDKSFFQTNDNLIILSVTLKLYLGDMERAKNTVNEWIKQKVEVQSMSSAGSVFKNPKLEECLPLWNEQKSTGWIIDHELNAKGKSIGDAQISPLHANFIVNNGQATAKDYLALINLIQSQMQEKFGFKFELEIKLLGDF